MLCKVDIERVEVHMFPISLFSHEIIEAIYGPTFARMFFVATPIAHRSMR